MQLIITHSGLTRSRVLLLNRWQLAVALVACSLALLLLAGSLYHLVFLKASSESWSLLGPRSPQEVAQRDRFMRENLDAMAQKVGEMQAKLLQLEAMGERVSGLAGVKAEEVKPVVRVAGGGQGGPFVAARTPSLAQLDSLIEQLDDATEQNHDLLTFIESRLVERRLASLMIPTSRPVDSHVGSGFGFRTDPFSGRPALHTGLDFPADTGTAIEAAAGGVVRSADFHPAYGRTLELDHGNGLVTRYAHTSKILVKPGDLIRRGQRVAAVGSSGRSTGSHLHFEVLLEGVPQDPAKFLAGGQAGADKHLAHAEARAAHTRGRTRAE